MASSEASIKAWNLIFPSEAGSSKSQIVPWQANYYYWSLLAKLASLCCGGETSMTRRAQIESSISAWSRIDLNRRQVLAAYPAEPAAFRLRPVRRPYVLRIYSRSYAAPYPRHYYTCTHAAPYSIQHSETRLANRMWCLLLEAWLEM